jgi:hypothetical protein
MNVIEIIRRTMQREGNLLRENSTYISSHNMMFFLNDVVKNRIMPDMLITPYLICRETEDLYELHYYEFVLDIGEEKSYYVEYNEKNTLPDEVTQKIKPRVIVAKGDIEFYINALSKYLTAMEEMQFSEDKEHYSQLENAELFYEIFMDEI